MALTEETIQDKIEIVGEFKHVQVRTATVIKRDGTEKIAYSVWKNLSISGSIEMIKKFHLTQSQKPLNM